VRLVSDETIEATGSIFLSGTSAVSVDGDSDVLLARVLLSSNLSVGGGVELTCEDGQYPQSVSGNITLTNTSYISTDSGTFIPGFLKSTDPDLCAVPYDTDDNDSINVFDLLAFLDRFGEPLTGTPADGDLPIYDYNRDSAIDVFDLLQFLDNFGKMEANGDVVLYPAGYPFAGSSAANEVSSDAFVAEKPALDQLGAESTEVVFSDYDPYMYMIEPPYDNETTSDEEEEDGEAILDMIYSSYEE
jgi:hypothetical protein